MQTLFNISKNSFHISPRRSSAAKANSTAGFTLVELIVAVALFAIVMMISVGALLSLTAANRKAQALQSVMNNLNVAIDGMVRSIRMGTNYDCGSGAVDNCPSGDVMFTFKPFCEGSCDSTNRWIYYYDVDGSICGGNIIKNRICKSEDGGLTALAVTAQEVTIDSMKFYVVGTMRGCDSPPTPCVPTQPKVVITISGTAGATNVKTRTTFSLQATAVQRVLDL